MSLERTLSIVKPDGVRKNVIGDVYHRFEKAGLRIVAARMMQLTQAQAEAFYGIHRERPFFKDLVSYMISGPVIVQVLEGEGAVAQEPRRHGRDRSEEGRAGHDPRRPRRQHRAERRARFGQRRERRARNRVLLRRDGALPALSAGELAPRRVVH